MLDEFWGVSMVDEAPHAGLRLRIPEEIQTRMEKEFILADDLRRVIHEGESTGDKLYLPESGHFVAHFRPSLVTYWVEYQEHEGEYRVFNTYSHRMRIVESARCK
jgi:hypothetical protein